MRHQFHIDLIEIFLDRVYLVFMIKTIVNDFNLLCDVPVSLLMIIRVKKLNKAHFVDSKVDINHHAQYHDKSSHEYPVSFEFICV